MPNLRAIGRWPMRWRIPLPLREFPDPNLCGDTQWEMIARKAGRQTIIEADELQRWICSLPTRCRTPENQKAVA
jgi:hypothetical protein